MRGRSGNGRTVKLHSTGLVPATDDPARADTRRPSTSPRPTADADTAAQQVAVPAGTDVARFTATGSAAGDDVDLYVYRDGTLVDSSTGSSPDAEVTLTRPAAGHLHGLRARARPPRTARPPPAARHLGGPRQRAALRSR